MPEIHVTKNGVLKLLKALKNSKAAGPYGIRPRVLKELSSELTAPILTLLFKATLRQQSLPDIWKHASVSPVYKKEIRQISPTIVLCLWSVFHVSS